MKDLFKPADFNFHETMSATFLPDRAASLANEKLNALIESWPVVYGLPGTVEWNKIQSKIDTHTARLAFLERIVKEQCKHSASWNGLKFSMSADRFDNRFANVKTVCMDCGVELQATWSEVKK